MLPYLKDEFGNPSSLHYFGRRPKSAIEEARSKVADLIGSSPKELIFTSSGTESNNLALKGVAFAQRERTGHIITSQIEHHSVLHVVRTLEKWGFDVTYLPVDKYGLIDPEDKKAIRKDTVDRQHPTCKSRGRNHSTHTGDCKITKEKEVLFHTDAVATTWYYSSSGLRSWM
jgi:cysteine desulfurase